MSKTMNSNHTKAELQEHFESPPKELVKLRKSDEDSFSDGDFAKAFCNFINCFYWREREDNASELHVIMHKDGDKTNPRYKYTEVPEEIYTEMWRRAYFPEDYGSPFGTWFGRNIKGEYEYEKYMG